MNLLAVSTFFPLNNRADIDLDHIQRNKNVDFGIKSNVLKSYTQWPEHSRGETQAQGCLRTSPSLADVLPLSLSTQAPVQEVMYLKGLFAKNSTAPISYFAVNTGLTAVRLVYRFQLTEEYGCQVEKVWKRAVLSFFEHGDNQPRPDNRLIIVQVWLDQ